MLRALISLFTALLVAIAIAAAVVGLGDSPPSTSTAIGPIDRLQDAANRAATALDETQRRATEAVAASVAPSLAGWIKAARDRALTVARPIPPDLRARLQGYFSADVLDTVRFRVGWDDGSRTEARVFRMLATRAVTLDSVIVFRDEQIAGDPFIWAHELAHVQQFGQWGVEDFAARYIRDHRLIEREAWDVASRYKMWALENGGLTSGLE